MINTTAFNPNFKLYQLASSVFLLEMPSREDLAYTFLRAQEFYESVNPQIQGSRFTLEEYKTWYSSQSKDKTFSYARDWTGFNVPSHAIERCYSMNDERLDEDVFFLQICAACSHLTHGGAFYMIGTPQANEEVLHHEVAHGLFSTNDDYKQKMLSLLATLPQNVQLEMNTHLDKMGYSSSVHADETQAYLSTGLQKEMNKDTFNSYMKIFSDVFTQYCPTISLPEPVLENKTTQKTKRQP